MPLNSKMRSSLVPLILYSFIHLALLKSTIRFDLSSKDEKFGYSGIIREDEYVVHVTPSIKILQEKDIEICHYNVISAKNIPFQIHIKNRHNGLASLIATDKLNCEEAKEYDFNITAATCNGNVSDPIPVHIHILDVNEFEPHFDEQVYNVEIEEGKIFEKLLKLQAYDRDCSFDYNSICNYIITNNHDNQYPFIITNEGLLSNTLPLNWTQNKNYILEVVAEDCGEKRSKPVLINIQVLKSCIDRWEDIEETINYTSSNGLLQLAPKANLRLCNSSCKIDHIITTVALSAVGVAKNCDRGEAISNVSLLGRLKPCLDPNPSERWVEDLLAGASPVSNATPSSIFTFDGMSDFIRVPTDNDDLSNTVGENVAPEDDGPVRSMGKRFSFAFWMRHGAPTSPRASKKEHVYCRADAVAHNRHHLALFVKNCRLVLLVRQEPSQSGSLFYHDPLAIDGADSQHHHGAPPRLARKRMFKPSEVRWRLPEVCDGAWHHYVVNIDFPRTFNLMVDSKPFKPNYAPNPEPNPEIVDDWPLHPIDPGLGVGTVSSVGACWEAKRSRMSHHFEGQLSDLVLIHHATLSQPQARCMVECRESLTLNSNGSPTKILAGDDANEVIFFPPGHDSPNTSFDPSNTITLKSRLGPSAASNALRALAYLNTAAPAVVGSRIVRIRTFVICASPNATTGPLHQTREILEFRQNLIVHNEAPITSPTLHSFVILQPLNTTNFIPIIQPSLHLGWESNFDYASGPAKDPLADEPMDVMVYRPIEDVSAATETGIKIFERVTLRLITPLTPTPPPDSSDYPPPLIIEKCLVTTHYNALRPGETPKFVLPANLITALGLEFERGSGLENVTMSDDDTSIDTVIVIRNPNLAAAYQNVLRQVHYFAPREDFVTSAEPRVAKFYLACHYRTRDTVTSLTNRLVVRLNIMTRLGSKIGRGKGKYVARRTNSIQSIPPAVRSATNDPLALVRDRASALGYAKTRGGTRTSSLWLVGTGLVVMIAFVATLFVRGSRPHSTRMSKYNFENGAYPGSSLPLKLLNKAGAKIGNLVSVSGQSHRGTSHDDREEMAWDDGSLNIIVNPMTRHEECGDAPFEPISLQTSSTFSTSPSENGCAMGKKAVEITAKIGNSTGATTQLFATNLAPSFEAAQKHFDTDSDFDEDDDLDDEGGDNVRTCVTDDDCDSSSSVASSRSDNRGDFPTRRDNDFRWIRGNNRSGGSGCGNKKTSPAPQDTPTPSQPEVRIDAGLNNGKRYNAGFKHFLTRSVKRIIESRAGSVDPRFGAVRSGHHSRDYESCPAEEPIELGAEERETTSTSVKSNSLGSNIAGGALEWDDSI